MLRLLAVILFLLAFVTGGCSIIFTFLMVGDPAGSAILPFWLAGLATGGLCLWAGLALWRAKRPAKAPEDTTR